MRRIAVVATVLLLTLASGPSVAQTGTWHRVTGAGLNGYGCIESGDQDGSYEIGLEFVGDSGPARKAKVFFYGRVPWPKQTEPVCASTGVATGQLVYRIQTDNNPYTFKIIKFVPNTELVISSPGRCGKNLENRATIIATITPSLLTIDCQGTSYSVKGKPVPGIYFK